MDAERVLWERLRWSTRYKPQPKRLPMPTQNTWVKIDKASNLFMWRAPPFFLLYTSA